MRLLPSSHIVPAITPLFFQRFKRHVPNPFLKHGPLFVEEDKSRYVSNLVKTRNIRVFAHIHYLDLDRVAVFLLK